MARTHWIRNGLSGMVIGFGLVAAGIAPAALGTPVSNQTASPQQPQTPATPAPPARPAVSPAAPPAASPQHDHGAPAQTPATLLGKPPVEFDPPILDFGIVRPGSRSSGTIFIQNASDKWLKIVATKPSCTCTSVDLANTPLAPGERVPMRADYHAGSVMGDKNAAIKVQIEGYDIVEVGIKASIQMPIRLDPGYISTAPAGGGPMTLNGEVTVISGDRKPFRILAVNGATPVYNGFDADHDEPTNAYRIKWDLTPYNPSTCTDAKGNRMPGWITVETDREECPVVILEVRHQCTARERPKKEDTWLIQDKCMLVGGVKPGAAAEFDLLANWFPKKDHNDPIRSVISESTQFTAELASVESVDGGMMCRIRVTPTADSKGLIYGVMRVHSNNQSFPITIIGSSRLAAAPARPVVEGAAPLQFAFGGVWWATLLALCGGVIVALYLVVQRRKLAVRAARTR